MPTRGQAAAPTAKRARHLRVFAFPARSAAACLGVVLSVVAAACSSRPPDDTADYVKQVTAARAQKDADFQNASDSPVPADKRADFLPLGYFPIDPDYRVPATLRPSSDATTLEMPTSTGQIRQMRRVGSLEFSVKGRPLKLSAFVEIGSPNLDHLFVPFTDLTSGTETYPAGRYLDLDRNATGIYIVDFNKAYQPYCYFNATYDCPYPPPENRLPVPIHAGERLKHPNR